MPSITSWMRLEPRSRNAEMNTSLQARIYDPLWLLARQWQLGEFQGEDNGSPVMARWRGESARLTRYHSGAIAPNTRVDAPSYDAAACRSKRWSSGRIRPAADQTSSRKSSGWPRRPVSSSCACWNAAAVARLPRRVHSPISVSDTDDRATCHTRSRQPQLL